MNKALFDLPILKNASRWIIAYSGGVDSHILLKLAVEAATDRQKILAVHIHHGLSPFADNWLHHCQTVAQDLNIEFKSINVNLADRQGKSLEAHAREARYAALANLVDKQDILLTGHHADDQAETFLLQLFRGAGIKGLSAMPAIKPFSKGHLVRPLLAISRQEIMEYAKEQHLSWITDESNEDISFDRNFIRHELMPLLQTRWPTLPTLLNRSAKHMADSDILLMDQGRKHYQAAQIELKPLNLGYLKTGIISRLTIEPLLRLSTMELNNTLRNWLHDSQVRLPSEKNLSRVKPELLDSAQDAQPLISWDKYNVRRFEGEIYLSFNVLDCQIAKAPRNDNAKKINPQKTYHWDTKTSLELPIGTLTTALAQELNLQNLVEVHFRKGGEHFHPANRSHSQCLKKLFQEWHIPTWLRDRIPLFYIKNELVAVLHYKSKR
jgi:tRNA(Ile)-lysidine synthase